MMLSTNRWAFGLLIAAISGICSVRAGGYNVLSLEPYVAEFCAAQFPDQIKNFTGYNVASFMRFRDYVRIEPHLANYCFDQFPDELKDQKREATLLNLVENHIQIEPYLMAWGTASMVNPSLPTRIELEPYLAEWCVKGQFVKLMKNPDQSLGIAAKNPVDPEGAFARYCFAQFSGELASLDLEQTVADVLTNHVKIEQYLIKWETAVYGAAAVQDHKLNTQAAAGMGFGAGFGVALAILLPIWGICWYRSRRARAKEAQFQRELQMTEGSDNNMSA
jgi:hypothetical protein